MKKILMAGCALLSLNLFAQQKQGKIIYERTMQLQISFAGLGEGAENMIPKTRTEKFELTFANNQSLWRQAEEEANPDESNFSTDNGMQIRISTPGSNDVLYTNLDTKKRVERRELFDKKFIVDDSIGAVKWKMTGETKNILGHNCMKATTEQISQRAQMTMNNGSIEKKDITDTSEIVAWFAMDIPVWTGPGEFQGQLPGAILEMNFNNGRLVYKALSISETADITVIKEPTGKKHSTPEEFRKEREKMLEEMQKNNMGGNRMIRVN